MNLTLRALTVAASLMASGASAFDPEDVQTLKDTNECVQCDLSEDFLNRATLNGAKLSGANLLLANLSGPKLSSVL